MIHVRHFRRAVLACAISCVAFSSWAARSAAQAAELVSLSESPYKSGESFVWPYELGLPTTSFTGTSVGVFGQFSSPSSTKAPVGGLSKNWFSSKNDSVALGGGATLGWLGKWSRASSFGYGVDASLFYDGEKFGGSGWRYRSTAGADILGRAGVFALRDNLFIYGLGGVAFDYGRSDIVSNATPPVVTQKKLLSTGLGLGLGAQMQVFEKVTMRADFVWKTFQWGKAPHRDDVTGRIGAAYHF